VFGEKMTRGKRQFVLILLLLFGATPQVSAQSPQSDAQLVQQLMEKIRLQGLNGCIEDAPAPQLLAEPRFTKGTSNVIGIVLPALDTTAFDPGSIKEPFIITEMGDAAGQVFPFPRPVSFPAAGNTLETVTGLHPGDIYSYSTALFLPVCLLKCDAVVDTSQLEIHCSAFADTVWSRQDAQPPTVTEVVIPAFAQSIRPGWLNHSEFEINANLADPAGVWQGFLYRRACGETAWTLVTDTTFAGDLTATGFAFAETASIGFSQNLPDGCYEFRVEAKDATHTPESFAPNFVLAGNGGVPAENAPPHLRVQIDTAPPQPVTLACEQVQDEIHLTWNAATDAEPGIGVSGYYIVRDGVRLAAVAANETAFADVLSGVAGVTNFSYQIQPFDSLGNVQTGGGEAQCQFRPQSQVTLVPEPPFTAGASNEICWNGSADIDSFTVFIAEACDVLSVGQVQTGDTCFTFTGLKDGVRYCYWVAAVDRFGRSVRSDTVTSIQDASAPVFDALDIDSKLLLDSRIWVNSKAVKLRVRADETAPGRFDELQIFENGTLSSQVSLAGIGGGLDSLFTYTIHANECAAVNLAVRLVDAAGNSSAQLDVEVFVDATPPAAVNDVACVQLQTINAVRVQWGAVVDAAGCSGLAGYRILRDGAVIADLPATADSFDDLFSAQQPSATFTYGVLPFDRAGNVQESGGEAVCDYQGLAAISLTPLPEFVPGHENEVCWGVSGSLETLQLFIAAGARFTRIDSFDVAASAVAEGCRRFSDLADGTRYFYWLRGIDAQRRTVTSDTVFAIQDATPPRVDDFSLPAGELVNGQLWSYTRDIELNLAAHDVPPGEIWQAEIFENGERAMTIGFSDSLSQAVQRIAYRLGSAVTRSTRIVLETVVIDGAGNRSQPQALELFLQEDIPAMFAFPNPFNPEVGSITIRLAEAAETELKIYDFFGNLVQTLTHKVGSHDFLWDGRNGLGQMVANGGYVCVGTKTHRRFKIGVVKLR